MRSRIASISVLLICLGVCATLFQAISHGCMWWECAPARPFKVLDLELPADLFPLGATVRALYPLSEGEGTLENGQKSVYWGDYGSGIANYEVLRFPSAKRATEVFSLDKQNIYVDRTTKGLWNTPSAVTFVSPKADEFFVGCGNWSEYRCGMIARYAEYVVQFNATMDSEMTYESFEKIVAFIDNQITTRLYP